MGIHEKFLLVEDDPNDAKFAIDELTNAGHKCVQYAGSFEDASNCILNAKRLGMTVVILDGNLNYYPDDCADGRAIAEKIREQAPEVTIVAHSRSSEKIANYEDIYVSKRAPLGKLAEVVTAIPRDQK